MLPEVDIQAIEEAVNGIVELVCETDELAEPLFLQPLAGLFAALRGLDLDDPGERSRLSSLTDRGIDLIEGLAARASALDLDAEAAAARAQLFALTCWSALRGAEIEHTAPVVDAMAGLANRLRHPDELAQLYGYIESLEDAFPLLAADAGPDQVHQLRVFLLNRAIVATRSHRLPLMRRAFDHLIEQLPDAAPELFREGMRQMEALDYPAPVRALMQQYHDAWNVKHRLH